MKRALVISGGGSKGAYAIGILKQFQQRFPTLAFDVFVGTSTGSLIIPLAVLEDIDTLEQIYTTQKEGSIVKKMRLGDRLATESIFDATPLWELINKHFTDDKYNQAIATGKALYLNTTCLQTAELVVFTTDRNAKSTSGYSVRQIQNADHFRRAIMASACQPVVMPPIQVNKNLPGHPEKDLQYVDGGLREYAGIEMAINAGATEIFTILLSPPSGEVVNKQYKDLFGLLERTIEIFTFDVGKNDLIIPNQFNQALTYIDAVKRKLIREGMSKENVAKMFTVAGMESPFADKVPLKLFTLRPDKPLGGGAGGLSFDVTEMRNMINRGMSNADLFLNTLSKDDISWA